MVSMRTSFCEIGLRSTLTSFAATRPEKLDRTTREDCKRAGGATSGPSVANTIKSSPISIRRSDSFVAATIRNMPAISHGDRCCGGSETIRNLEFATNAQYFKGVNGKIETRTQDLQLGVQFFNNAGASLMMTQTFDRLLNGIRIQGLPVPAGDYKYLAYSAQINTDRSEKIGGAGRVDWGEFWDGRRRSISGSLLLKPNYRFNATLDYSRNLLKLSSGTTTTDLVGARFLLAFSPRSFINAFFQYSSRTHEVSTNIRFNLTYRPLSDIYLVYNDRRSSLGNELLERAFIVKVTSLFNF